ncbi:UMTA [Colletotrichum chrysophilum]|uniref:UMTA n=1 Tax=Colletotrichum chrysophilum TaxID=1836956 RepID=A0AAD9A4J8_9PEZI|nr:UMTA [Colletotrichum chrysophilum]
MAQTSANIPKDSGEAILAADETTDDAVSVLGSISSSSASVSSSILDYRTENGRTYHRYKDGKYSYPNDETESDRLEMQHNLFLVTYDNKLGTAPPNDTSLGVEVKRVLDVGTGTGVWAVEFGDEHPEAEVLGVDLSAIQPDFAPPNVKFEIDDIEEPWTFAQPFDYIHSRMMTSSLGLAPGGYFEMNEMDHPTSDDGTLRPEHALHRYLALVFSALEKSGRAFQSIPALRGMMLDIGFRDVTMTKYKWPTNPWAKDAKHKKIGAWSNENLNAGVEAWAMAPFTRVHGWTRVEGLEKLFTRVVARMAGTRSPKSPKSPQKSAGSSPAAASPAHVAPETDGLIVADDTIDDGASSIGSLASSTTSVSGSILDYRLENGRTYHRYKDGNLQHHMFLLTHDNKLGTAPPNEKGAQVKRALDVGTGTGLWAIEFGDEHPEAEVIGVDLSAVQVDFVPPNVRFEIDDIEEPWTFSKPFDYIHSRMMTSSIANWKSYLQKCYDGLEPGGYLELDEFDIFPDCDDDTFTGDLAISKALGLLAEAMAKIGRAFQSVPELRQMMVDVGFEDVHFKQYKWPINTWPKDPKYKELGMWENENLNMGFEGFLMGPLTRILDWSPAEVQVLLIDVRQNLNNRNVHAYWPVYSLWGRKPTEEVSN